MKRTRTSASLWVAALLPWLPLLRGVTPLATSPGAPWAVVLRWAVGIAAVGGGCHAVSAASATISGLTRYVSGKPSGSPTNVATGRVGAAFTWRVTVKDAGVNPEKAFYDCRALPPGLVIDTSVGASGLITGTPTLSGTFPVTLVAGNTEFVTPATAPLPTPITAEATIVIAPAPQPPTIQTPPSSVAVIKGASASLGVTVQGAGPLRFQWLRNNAPLLGATNSTLEFDSVTAANAGGYAVTVSNPDGTATSSSASLTVLDPAVVQLQLTRVTPQTNGCLCTISGPTNLICIVWFSADLVDWLPVATNQLTDGILSTHYDHPKSPASGFYRVSNQP
ncbi:MAG TPA: immunoglobulin domain-containing protein [Candidatus Limnocylindria bacterium]|jgi:hypothetical protein|nr:immunoglobulin domain-containing protein [Candidatus Limnocylindria bacterium]